jgi:PAS domain S-box-containing protein
MVELLVELEQYAMCLVPLRSSARGALFVTVGQPPGFDDTAFRIVQAVARQAANLVDHARTFQKLQHAARVRAGLAGLAAAVNRETDPVRIAQLVGAEVAALFRLSGAAVLLPQRDGLVVGGDHGLAADGLFLPLQDDTAVLVQAFRQGRAVFQNELAESPMGGGPLCRDLGLKSVFVLPLVGREGPIGVLLLGHKERSHGFSQEIADEALVLGPIASAALERATLFQQVERSEEQFRSLIENASDLIAIVGQDGAFRYQSPSVERILGYGRNELIGQNIAQLIHPDDRFPLGQMFQTILGSVAPRAVGEARFRHQGGAWRVLEGVGTRMVGPDGVPVVVVNSRDVTERKRAEVREAGQKRVLELLARGGTLEEVLTALVDGLDDDQGSVSAVLVLDDDRTALQPIAAGRLPQPLREALRGIPVGLQGSVCGTAAHRRQRVVDDLDRDPRCRADHEAATAGLRSCWAEPIISAAGEVLGVLALFHPTHRAAGPEETGIIGAAAHLAGIAIERKRAEHELATARDEAVTAARLKAEFLANMSHEIRTPMNGVVGMADLLAESRLEDDQRDFVNTIRSSAEALLTVINDILDVSKIEAGKMTIEHVAFDLRSLLEETAELLAPRASRKHLELICAMPDSVPDRLVGDPHRLRQVLTNLVGNAIKFTDEGRVTVEVEVVAETATHVRVRLAVRDTGIGIPPERREVIFDSFTQADGSTTRRYGGTGLGLTISRQLVELMGGQLGVESQPGEGSTFWVEIGFEKERAPRAHDRAAPATLAGLRVLVVDDYEVNRRVFCGQLRSWGCVADEATSGPAALAALRAAVERDPYRLVLLDANMPGMDGETTAEAIRTDPRLAALPLVLLSSVGAHGSSDEMRAKGFAAALTKPLRRSHLLDVVSAVTGAARDGSPRPGREPGPAAGRLGLRVLLAEDNAVNRQVALEMLRRLGCRADAVDDGARAIAATAADAYDVVLMDLQMPGVDGFEATAEIRWRERQTGRHLPVIAMTARAMEGDRERCLAAGMDGYLAKPVKMMDLARALEPYAGGAAPGRLPRELAG